MIFCSDSTHIGNIEQQSAMIFCSDSTHWQMDSNCFAKFLVDEGMACCCCCWYGGCNSITWQKLETNGCVAATMFSYNEGKRTLNSKAKRYNPYFRKCLTKAIVFCIRFSYLLYKKILWIQNQHTKSCVVGIRHYRLGRFSTFPNFLTSSQFCKTLYGPQKNVLQKGHLGSL